MWNQLEDDVFDDLVNRNSPEAIAMRRHAIEYVRTRDIVEGVNGRPDDMRVMTAKRHLAQKERALYRAALKLAIHIVNGGQGNA